MSRVAPVVPAESDILCEGCGYTLNGLPESGRCPECGRPIAQSTVEDRREPPAFERNDAPWLTRFLRTTAAVTFRPTNFYRSITTRAETSADRTFARVHWAFASLLFGGALVVHAQWYWNEILGRAVALGPWLGITVGMFVVIYSFLDGITRLAARLTAWEAAYRGFRLPYRAVLRAMHYHAAHYLPVALMAFITVAGYQVLLLQRVFSPASSTRYLYVLCAEVILGAVYLFQTYWIAMRNMMYANR